MATIPGNEGPPAHPLTGTGAVQSMASSHQENIDGQDLTDHLAYWQQLLAGAPAGIELPTDHPRSSTATTHTETLPFALSGRLGDALRELSRQENASPLMTFLAAFSTLLFRYSGQEDMVIGAAASDMPSQPGALPLPLRFSLSGDLSFRALLKRTREVVLTSLTHPLPSLEAVSNQLHNASTDTRQPLFQTLLTLGSTPYHPSGHSQTTAAPDLALHLDDQAEGFDGGITYNADLFDASTIQRLTGHWQTLLEGIAADPDQSLARLPLLTAAERQQLLVEWNNTEAPYPQDVCVHHLFEEEAEKHPDAVAAVFKQQQLTYRQLNERANQLAHYLRAQGVGPDSLVGLALPRSLEMVVGLLGVLKAGGAYVPLDPTYPRDRLAFMVSDARIPILITLAELEATLPSSDAQVLCLDRDWPLIAEQPTHTPSSGVTPTNLVYVLYTSGSTGRPKGAMIQHQGVVNYLHWGRQAYQIAGGTGAPVQSTLSFDATVTSFFGPLVAGRTVTLLPEEEGIEALGASLRATSTFSLLKITPAHLELLNQTLTPEEFARQSCAVVIGGEALRAETLTLWRTHAPRARLINEYGPTETVVGCCVYEVDADTPAAGPVLIGRPIANTQLYILDGQLQPVPVGVAGELYIGGAGLARGYLNRPDLTEEKFIPHPFSSEPGARLYKTGDLARYRPDGILEYLGRIDQQVKIRGYRIELGEIESTLAQHPGVRETAVVAREDTPGDKRLVAYIVQNGQEPLSSSVLRGFLKEQLPAYMVPSAFVFLEALPLTPNGKVDRRALPVPNSKRHEAEDTYVAPRTPLEEHLAAMWSETLSIEQIGVYDNFFELGGHSLLAIHILSQLQEQFQIQLSLESIFENPSIEGLSTQIEQKLISKIAMMSDEEAALLLEQSEPAV